MQRSIAEHTIIRVAHDGLAASADDFLALEEPLEIRLGYFDDQGVQHYRSLAITMRTPGDDLALACGFLFSESLISSYADIACIKACGPVQSFGQQNIVRIDLKPHCQFRIEQIQRHFYTSSSCGICGKSSLEALAVAGLNKIPPPLPGQLLSVDLILSLPALLQRQQKTFHQTGGLHASGLFSRQGQLLRWGEDVGRHNALDKVIGAALAENNMPLENSILLLSGRASFELLQKAIKAGIPAVAAIGAPSSLAVALAQEFNVLLLGFLRDRRFNVYHNNGLLPLNDHLLA